MEISSVSSPTLSLSSIPKPAIAASKSSSLFLTQSTSTFLRSVNNSGLRLPVTRVRPGYPARKKGFSCTCMFGLGVPEIAVIAGVAVLLFGPKQLPEVGRSIGKTIKGFQQAAKEFESELKKPEEQEEPKPESEAKEAKAATGNAEAKDRENVNVS